ncbi:Rad52/Rad22 family DNA repair protein [Streptomyces sp. NPDC048157]|uniref:Rad52/Rad22 family DNA repair protein n=1 Tax=Streptomyces sp. NPDC048157 TaxID=3365503 RepID=UPI00371A1C8A
MATAVEAPASNTAEGPTSHTQNQTARFSPYQLRMLHGGINGNRVRNLRGMSHLEAWDVRRQLIRIFGFGGFDIETIGLDLVSERETKQGERSRWTVVYRAQVRLILKNSTGTAIAYFDDGAAGDSVNQPSLGDAHDMAMKTAFSQALKRCAVNLGDQFGLSLYNDGSQDPVVVFSAAHPPQEWKPQAQPPEPEPEDPPVRPEPSAQEAQNDSHTVTVPEQAPAAMSPAQTQELVLTKFLTRVREGWNSLDATVDVLAAAHANALLNEQVPFGEPKVPTRVEDMLNTRIAQLRGSATEQSSAGEQQPSSIDPIDQLMLQVQRHWNDFTELTKDVAEAGRRNQLLREVEGPVGGWVPFGDMVTARIAELKEQTRQAEQNAHAPERSAA